MATTSPVEVEPDLTPDEITLTDKPWVTIVWNDPVNLMSYVTYVFRTYFGYDQKKAERPQLIWSSVRPRSSLMSRSV